MPVDAAFVEKLAPDQASLQAAVKLLRSGAFTRFASDSESSLVWGECQGSGAVPYRLVAALDDIGYKCTCPSRKFPCKHVLALFWRFADQPASFIQEETPDWVQDWISRRRGPVKVGGAPKGSTSAALADAVASSSIAADPGAGEKAQRQRERLRAEREAAILDGLNQLETWLEDQVARGLAGFSASAEQHCRLVAKRLVDAKAPGLANWIDFLPAHQLRLPEAERPGWLVEQFGLLSLAIEAYRRQDALPGPLVADIRRVVGWTIERKDLLADPEALRVADRWRVIATLIEPQPDGLQRVEVWFERASATAPRFAALIDHLPANAAIGVAFTPGEAFEATLAFYPSEWPFRAVIETRGAAVENFFREPPPSGLEAALAIYRDALARQPWLDRVPIAASGLTLGRSSGRLALIDEASALAFPIAEAQSDQLGVLLGSRNLETCGLWNGRTVEVLRLDGPYGSWYAE